jgi:hypothetical protein
MTTISCCIGDCKHILQLKPRLITEHIKKYHPQAYIQLNSDYIFYCATCDTFTSYIHFHCLDCNLYFKNKLEMQEHYSLAHKLWFLEKDCMYGQSCTKQICRYNHYIYEQNYIVEKVDYIPPSICEYDLPYINIRCDNIYCIKDHFMGRK